jgi:hypothetical protein
MRGTVHLVPTEDFTWMEPLFAERIQGWSLRRLDQLGVSEAKRDRALEAIRKELDLAGRLRRSDAMAVAEKAGVEMRPELRIHFISIAVLSGVACIGPDEGGANTLVDRRQWIGEPAPADREAAMMELARRYFAAFAPASDRDFAYWAGLPLGDCRAAIERIAAEMQEMSGPDGPLLAPKHFSVRVPRSPVVRLLGAFDT